MSQLFFKKQFHSAIRDGTKQTTIRRWLRARVKVGRNAYAPGIGWLSIEGVDQIDLNQLDENDARADGFATHALMLRTLAELYPDQLTDGKQWFRIAFTIKELNSPRVQPDPAQLPLF